MRSRDECIEVEPNFQVSTESPSREDPSIQTVVVSLPGVHSSAEVEVDHVEKDGVVEVIVPGRYRLKVKFPDSADPLETKVQFKKRSQQLSLKFKGRALESQESLVRPTPEPLNSGAPPLAQPTTEPLSDDQRSSPPCTPSAAPPAASSSHPLQSLFPHPLPVVVRDSEACGRFLCATETLPPGTLVLEEEAMVSVVHDKYATSHCHQCFQPLPEKAGRGVRCSGCGYAVFCSPACLAAAEKGPHAGGECAVLAAWASGGGPKESRGLRLFLRCARALDQLAPRLRTLTLPPLLPQAERDRLVKMAGAVNRFLPESQQVPPGDLTQLLSRVHVNLHGITDLRGLTLGPALFQAASLFNHSCDPSCVASFIKGAIQVRTLREVPAGEELSIAYIDVYMAPTDRQNLLRSSKYFHCACSRCRNTEAVKRDLPISSWVCSKCDGLISDREEKCEKCGTPFPMLPNERLDSLYAWRRMLDTGKEMMATGRLQEGHTILSSVVETASEKGLHPHHALLFQTLRALLDLAKELSRNDLAVTVGHKVLACMKAHFPKFHPSNAYTLEVMGSALLHEAKTVGVQTPEGHSKIRQVCKMYRKASKLLSVVYGANHWDVLTLNEQLHQANCILDQLERLG